MILFLVWISNLFLERIRNSDNMDDLHYMKDKLNPSGKGEVRMLSDFIPNQKHKEVPDCYYAHGSFLFFFLIIK